MDFSLIDFRSRIRSGSAGNGPSSTTSPAAASCVQQIADAGAGEIACLIDFGIDTETVLSSPRYITTLATLVPTAHASSVAQSRS